jgi:rubredoxin
MKKYVCDICGWEYDPAMGDPEGGAAPNTPFEDLPLDWSCPVCGAAWEQFSPERK